MKINEIYHGSALDVLKTFEPESVDLVVTSPPYYGLRDYKTDGQVWDGVPDCEHEWGEEIPDSLLHANRNNNKGPDKEVYANPKRNNTPKKTGSTSSFCLKCSAWRGSLGMEPTPQLYIQHLIQVFGECRRVLKKTGSLWVNIGDTYNSSKWSIKNVAQTVSNGNERDHPKGRRPTRGMDIGIPDKSLIGIPERLVIAMTDELNLIRRNTIIWQKSNCMPSSAKDRFTIDFEYFYFWTKSPKYYFKTQYEPLTSPEKDRSRKNIKFGGTKYPGSVDNRTYSGKDWNPDSRSRIKRCMWKVNTVPFREAHFATFPEKLITTPIAACCPSDICNKCGKVRTTLSEFTGEYDRQGWATSKKYASCPMTRYGTSPRTAGILTKNVKIYKSIGLSDCGCAAGFHPGVVLDPFMGSGTVAVVARKQRKNYLGIELNQEYIDMSLKRIRDTVVNEVLD